MGRPLLIDWIWKQWGITYKKMQMCTALKSLGLIQKVLS